MCPRLHKILREIGGVVNTAIVIGAANGIVGAQNCGLLVENGGHVNITNGDHVNITKSLFCIA